MEPLDLIMNYIQNTDGGGINPFSYWGDYGKTAKEQGWYAATSPDSAGRVTFRAPYNAPFNIVQIPGDKSFGHIALVGSPNGKFDIVINHADGSLEHMIMQGVSAEQAEKWITSPDNTIAQRINNLQKTQYDKMSKSQVQEVAVNK
jgi:hypothetical protein